MINCKKFILIGLLSSFILGQSHIGGQPLSRNNSIDYIDRIVMGTFDVDAMIAEDESRSFGKTRYGKVFDVDFSSDSNGVWETLDDGSIIWRLMIKSPNAYSIGVSFADLVLPEGSRLYAYSSDYTELKGGYTSFNNSIHFSTPLLIGDSIIIEYNSNAESNQLPNINIVEVIHDYKDIFNTILDRNCGINVACSDADPYEDEINSAAWLDMGGYICSGAMINNTANDKTPYFLTANHCTQGDNPSSFRFYFNYETNSCNGNNASYGSYAYGSQLMWASNDFSGSNSITENDLTLLRINGTIYDSWNVFYAGWNRSNSSSIGSSVGVHHPDGDPKKISFTTGSLYTDSWSGPWGTHWKVFWEEGGTEGGSSGSPIFDDNGRIIGPLSGGPDIACGTNGDYASYGKLNYQWASIDQYLDPLNTGATSIAGIYDSEVSGCTDPSADNYNPNATQDDGSCEYTTVGDATLSFGNISGNNVEIILFNSVPVAGFQFIVSDNPNVVELSSAYGGTSESTGMTISTSEDGTVLAFSLTGSTISAGSSILTNLSFIGPEETTLCLSDAIISSNTAEPLGISYGECISYSGSIAGDINGDSIINIQDIVQVIGVILGSIDPTNAQEAAADVNGDNNINIQDIIIIINMILD